MLGMFLVLGSWVVKWTHATAEGGPARLGDDLSTYHAAAEEGEDVAHGGGVLGVLFFPC